MPELRAQRGHARALSAAAARHSARAIRGLRRASTACEWIEDESNADEALTRNFLRRERRRRCSSERFPRWRESARARRARTSPKRELTSRAATSCCAAYPPARKGLRAPSEAQARVEMLKQLASRGERAHAGRARRRARCASIAASVLHRMPATASRRRLGASGLERRARRWSLPALRRRAALRKRRAARASTLASRAKPAVTRAPARGRRAPAPRRATGRARTLKNLLQEARRAAVAARAPAAAVPRRRPGLGAGRRHRRATIALRGGRSRARSRVAPVARTGAKPLFL